MSKVSGERLGELRRVEKLFDIVTENVEEVIFVASADLSEIEYVSPAYEEVFGRPVESLYEEPWSFLDAVHPDDHDRYEADMEAMVADLEADDPDGRYEGEYRLGGDGDPVRWIRVERYPVRDDETGTIDRFVGVLEDVTERRELERTYRDVFEHVSDGLVVHEPATGEILDVNERYCELTGYDRGELVGNGIDIIVSDDPAYTLDVAAERIERAREEGPQLFEFRGERKSGETFMGEVHLSLVELRGEERVLASVRDITERKRHERVVRTLHETTQRIQNAPTREAVCEAAVDAAVDVLDLSMPACWLPVDDGEDGAPVLEPVAASDAAWELPGGPGTFELGHFEHDVYAGDEAVVYDPSERWDRTPLERAFLVPLGDHGLLGAAEPGVEEFDDVVLDAARILARHTTAALARVARAEERRESERRLRTVLERIDEAVLLTDEGHLEGTTDPHDRLTSGYGPIWGRSYDGVLEAGGILETVHPEDRAAYCETFESVVAAMDGRETTEGRSLEYRIERPDGELRWVRSDVYPLLWDEAGHRLVVVSRDITERKRRQREYEQIFDGVNDAIAVFHPETAEILDVNERYHELVGYDDLETIHELGIDGLSATGEEYTGERGREVVRRVAASGEPETLEWLVETGGGERRWVETTVAPATIGGEDRCLAILRDVTERKRRQQTLSSFHDATRELTDAASREAASRLAVDAAERTLAFPVVSVHLYDETTGALDAVAASDELDRRTDDLPTFGPGSGVPWEVFAEREAVREPALDGATDVYGPAVPAPEFVLPLGEHGVMLVGAPDRELAGDAVELAQILAATLEAALNHIQGRDELAEREAELEEHRERAARLERLNTVIRDIEQATVDRGSREAVERALCERLTTVDSYATAWVSEPAPASDRLVVRTSEGEDGHPPAAGAELGGTSPGRHPAAAAHETESAAVVNHLATCAGSREWRSAALRAGYQSLVAVPLAYDGTVYGVATVAATEPAAFDEQTTEVLAELGRSVGHAASVLERRAALESDTTTELEFDVADEGLLFVRLASETGAEVTVERTIRRSGGSFGTFYTVEGVCPDRAIEAARAATGDGVVDPVTADTEAGVCLLEVEASSWFGSGFAAHGAVLRTATATPDGGRLVVEAPRGTDVRALVESFQEQYPETELVAQRTRERAVQSLLELEDLLGDRLTRRQLEVLETAYSAGYFEWPRQNSGEEVADLLGVTQPTFNKHIRAAERKAFGMLLERDYDRDEE